MQTKAKGLSSLRKGRIAVPGARYFITVVTKNRCLGLDRFSNWSRLLELAAQNTAVIWALVLMPDHFHALFVLPQETTPGDVVRGLKGPLTVDLRNQNLGWQRNYFEHRLRADEAGEPYLRYMLANPYRAGLVALDARWPFWAITSPNARWFIDKFPKQLPEPEWLAMECPWARESD
ncbi:MAG: hypothetical protein EA353_08500 [Puniceicoccaceae bacterium]|nr:MAG: hypothetical protein EA353_08500 [Puniceicoccaceae bacterium]